MAMQFLKASLVSNAKYKKWMHKQRLFKTQFKDWQSMSLIAKPFVLFACLFAKFTNTFLAGAAYFIRQFKLLKHQLVYMILFLKDKKRSKGRIN
jgi:hypothetical protein